MTIVIVVVFHRGGSNVIELQKQEYDVQIWLHSSLNQLPIHNVPHLTLVQQPHVLVREEKGKSQFWL